MKLKKNQVTRKGKFEIFPEENYYRYRLKASNGETLFLSEIYSTQDSANKSIESVKRNADVGTIRIICDKRGLYKFKLIAGNNRVLITGANYSTEKGALNAMESFKRFASTAETIVLKELQCDEKDSSLELAKLEDVIDKTGGRIEILKEVDGEFYWYLKASNGEILASTEGYTSKSSALNSIEMFRKGVEDGVFYISKDKRSTYQYKLYSNSGRLLVIGESYNTKSKANSAVNSVRSFYKKAVMSK